MDPFSDEPTELGQTGVLVRIVVGGRRQVAPDAVLRALVARAASVPSDDVELVHACDECGARHGRVHVAYPLTASGAHRYADVAIDGGAIIAATGTRHPLGVAVEPAAAESGVLIDEAALHPDERRALRSLGPDEAALVRATLWARKTALLRALGHTDFIEPSRLAVSAPNEDGGVGRIERGVPEFGSFWRAVSFHDVPVPGPRAASVAILG
ncbi:4'-phosphopantetheinyl transferase superfamily protein [Agromyces salentinus]|uniref:4'-phosphopantetheinyl transferase superfamily protein n=1 Tax=Agromyces salentinus TaxID=269421 RepID=UPI0012F7F48F|nr:4'-phosphopantetheinyl transferase superfamily protein [Agromyces salentinus]